MHLLAAFLSWVECSVSKILMQLTHSQAHHLDSILVTEFSTWLLSDTYRHHLCTIHMFQGVGNL
jgi:hypothetical protein